MRGVALSILLIIGSSVALAQEIEKGEQIALIVPMTGPYGDIGLSLFRIATIALADEGVLGKEIHLCDEGTLNVLECIVNSGARVILGPVFSQTLATLPASMRKERLFLSLSTKPLPPDDGIFSLPLSIERTVELLGEFMLNFPLHAPALVYPNTPYGALCKTILLSFLHTHTAPIEYYPYTPSHIKSLQNTIKLLGHYQNIPLPPFVPPPSFIHPSIVFIAGHKQDLKHMVSFFSYYAIRSTFFGDENLYEALSSSSSSFSGENSIVLATDRERWSALQKRYQSLYDTPLPSSLGIYVYDTLTALLSLQKTTPQAQDLIAAGVLAGRYSGLFQFLEGGEVRREVKILKRTKDGWEEQESLTSDSIPFENP